jgi:Protein of unknown function (DUF1579)
MPEQDANMDAMLQAWLSYAQPGQEHSRLAGAVGTWTQETKLWQFPGTEPQVAPSAAEMKTIFGGRYLLQEMKGNLPGGAGEFEGLGLFGYDNFKNKHFFAWIDNTTTTLMLGEGAADELGTITYYSEIPDPMTGGMAQVKSVLSIEGENTQTFKMYRKQPDDSWFLTMEVTSTRKA